MRTCSLMVEREQSRPKSQQKQQKQQAISRQSGERALLFLLEVVVVDFDAEDDAAAG